MLTPQGPASYYCAQLSALQAVLEKHGYQSIATKGQYEALRFQLSRSIVILYYNGTVLLQGADLDTPRRLFARLVEAEQQTLPF